MNATSVGRYQPLYEYLRDRYADRLVLSFAQIEDLVGFTLPPEARLALEWWAADDAVAGAAWRLADRRATINLHAQTVVYERNEAPARAQPAR